MKKQCKIIFLILIFFNCIVLESAEKRIKILHLSFHRGCIKDFEDVSKSFLDLELTSWFIQDNPQQFDDLAKGSAVYNIGHDRAERVWRKNKDYFNQFDIILTSDTAPLSRIFLQNNWQKPLIIWVCNRFDYYDGASLDCHFPDKEYYQLIRKASTLPNVRVISYTPYERFYALQKNVYWPELTIKPIGSMNDSLNNQPSLIPSHIDKQNTLFVHPRLESWGLHPGRQFDYIQSECNLRNVPVFTGSYRGPDDIKDFKGVIFFPYAWSNLILFENMARGIVHFVPTIRFVKELVQLNRPVTYFALDNLELCEWYLPEYKDSIVYFDSWDDLRHKINTTDYTSLKHKISEHGRLHRERMITLWRSVFNSLIN